ncbi:unnamed protein product [Arctia plantaginis]|uniref:protein-tyrosine-phosphatase n=1 Tax=Arctia plantaginis TaxID=874455 RepID=A0A8S0Z2F5_ARCPL|nr:unnamed protein product [Arctia plantaginis]
MSQNNVSINKFEEEYAEIVSKNAWPLVYQKIGMECQRFRYTWNEAKKPKNKPLNRYRDVNPYDHTRVVLKRSETDYINANYVTLERANRRYILTQGPLAFTVGHFWLMIWEQNTKAILMLNKVIEKNEVKCHWYWPQKIDEEMHFSDVNMTVMLAKEEDCGYYSLRLFKLYDHETSTSKDVLQYHYTTWPDFGVPTSPVAFLNFLKRVRESGVLDPTDGPPVIHCSAGIGRSGTFCLVDCCLVIVEQEGIENLNIQEILLELRRHRMGLIQTPDQLRFSYQAVIEGTKRLDPNFEEEEEEEVPKATVQEEQAPPPPPRRTESLNEAPIRPLPPIPTSESLGNLMMTAPQESSSDESLPPLPTRESPTPTSSADEEESVTTVAESPVEPTDTLRQRRNRELADRVSGMKKRAREAERWHALKRFKKEDDKQKNRAKTEVLKEGAK